MRLIAIHDAQGSISALVVQPPNSPPGSPAAAPGQSVTEVEAPDVQIDLGDPASFERLVEVLEHYRIEVKGKLTNKPPKAG